MLATPGDQHDALITTLWPGWPVVGNLQSAQAPGRLRHAVSLVRRDAAESRVEGVVGGLLEGDLPGGVDRGPESAAALDPEALADVDDVDVVAPESRTLSDAPRVVLRHSIRVARLSPGGVRCRRRGWGAPRAYAALGRLGDPAHHPHRRRRPPRQGQAGYAGRLRRALTRQVVSIAAAGHAAALFGWSSRTGEKCAPPTALPDRWRCPAR